MSEGAKRKIVSWDEIDRDSRLLAERVKDLRPWKGIIAVTRGGLAPAAIISYELGLRLVDTLCVSTYDYEELRGAEILKAASGDGEDMLVIEDIVDTGITAKLVKEMMPKAYFASLYAKPQGLPYVDTYLNDVVQDVWIYFPWDPLPVLAAARG